MTPRFHLIDDAQTAAQSPELTPPAMRPSPLTPDAAPVQWGQLFTSNEDTLYLPQGYEPRYPYPLLVWLQLPGQAPVRLHEVMNDLSDRNYCGLRLELPESPSVSTTSGNWEAAPVWQWDSLLREAILELRNAFHIHSERIYLAGIGAGGIAAIRQLLCRPEWFAGAIAIHSELPTGPVPMPNFSELQGKRVWISQPEAAPVDADNRSLRVMDLAGMNVHALRHASARAYDRKLLVQVDRWLMHGICHPQHA